MHRCRTACRSLRPPPRLKRNFPPQLTNLPGQWLQCHATGWGSVSSVRAEREASTHQPSEWNQIVFLMVAQVPHGVPCSRRPRPSGTFFFFFFTPVTGPRRSLSLKLSDTRVDAPQMVRETRNQNNEKRKQVARLDEELRKMTARADGLDRETSRLTDQVCVQHAYLTDQVCV